MVNYKINVYLKHTEMENMYVREFIELVTQDINGNNFEFTVYEDDNVYDLTNKRVTMVVKSDSGTVIQENCQVVDAKRGKATITLPPDMLIENGPYMAEVQIWEGVNSRVTTLPFDYTVRLSLENDESIKADPRFSLLQVALQNVNDADGKSKEALKLSKEAKAICDDLVPQANTAAQNAQEALDRAESVVTQEELAQKVMLDGKDTKFDFIENSSIGIVDTVSKTGGQIKISDTFDYSDSFVFGFKYIANSYTINGANRFLFNLKNDNLIVSCIQLGDASGIIGGFSLDIRRNDNTIVFQGRALFKVEKNVPHQVLFTLKDNVPSFFFDGALITFSGDGLYKVESNFPNGIFIGGNARPFDGKLIYNFYNYSIPAPQEIEHSFSVLNNYPSIKELHTTDSTGKTSILKLASDTDHVEDRAGRTQEQINRTFYKRMCKEMPSQNGEPITVKNGEEGYVLSAEIKGNTQLFKRAKGSQDEWIVIPNDEGRDTVAFEYKLDSTQAIISNNGEKYPIYATEEDKANKKVISLPFEEDKVTLNDDGSATWIKAGETNLVLTGVENWVLKPDYSSDITLTCMCDLNVSKKDNVVICDKLNYITTPELKSKRGVYGGGWNGAIYMSLLKTELETADLSGFKKWLSINKPSFTYMIESHVTTHIPKELMPTILTDKTNILEAGGAVKPSSFKVTLPVDRIAELTARLEAVESKTNTQPVNTAFVDETYAKSVNKIEEVIK